MWAESEVKIRKSAQSTDDQNGHEPFGVILKWPISRLKNQYSVGLTWRTVFNFLPILGPEYFSACKGIRAIFGPRKVVMRPVVVRNWGDKSPEFAA